MNELYQVVNERRHELLKLISQEAFQQNESLPPPDLQTFQTALLSTPHIMIEDCLCYLEWCKREKYNGYIDILHDIMNYYWNRPAFQPRLTNWRNRERNTIEQHIWNIIAEARDSGELNELDSILDYALPGCDDWEFAPDKNQSILSCYEFDDRIEILPGSSEGIYLHWDLLGRFRQEQAKNEDVRIRIATIKTLKTDLSAYKTMGATAGILEYFAQKYVGNNLKLYTPDKDLPKN